MDLNKKLSSLQEISKAQLSKILSINSNSKYLILQPEIIRPLEKVCGVKWLKGNGVEKIFKLEDSNISFNTNAVYYMIFSFREQFTHVLNQIRPQIDIENPPKNKFHVIVVPRNLHNFQIELEELGLFDPVVKLHPFLWMPLNLDDGILSFEIPQIYSDVFVNQDKFFFPCLSKILWQLSLVIGKPKVILSLGQYSNVILKQFEEVCEERGDTDRLESDFGALIIVDRSADYPSAFLTPGTYSGLLSEVYKVKTGICEHKEEENILMDEKFNPKLPKHPVNIILNSSIDKVYSDIKYRYFTEVTTVLSSLTKQLKTEQSSSKDMALDEIKRYVQTQLQETKTRKKFISNHLLAAETIINVLGPRYENQTEIEFNIMHNKNKSYNFNYLEQSLCIENDRLISLRLFCLMCVTQKLYDNEIKSFWRKFLFQFGFDNGYAFTNLTSLGFVNVSDEISSLSKKFSKIPSKFISSNNFYTTAKNLRQIPAESIKTDMKHPTCASYVFGGCYIPLITQICSLLLNSIPIDDIRTKLEALGGGVTIKNDRGYPLQSRTILVYVIGGITYGEIASCNLLENLTGSKIVVMSDRIVTGNDLAADLLEPPK